MKDIDQYLNSIAENSNTYNFIKQEIGENSFISMISNKELKKSDKNEKKLAELVSVGLGDNAIQFITDSMANNIPIQIEYEGSGFREALAYGWSVSKDNNLLLMCYKPDGSIRSYRFDRLLQVMVDDSIINAYNQQSEQQIEVKEHEQPQDHIIPTLPNIDEIIEETENEQVDERELPYDEAIETLENDNVTHKMENQLLDDINDMNEDTIDMREEDIDKSEESIDENQGEIEDKKEESIEENDEEEQENEERDSE